jgi:two-component system NtrC family sensor kinase
VGLWVAFLFGAALGGLLGHALGRRAGARARVLGAATPVPGALHTPIPVPRAPRASGPTGTPQDDVGADDVLNALNNRLAAVSALADLLPGAGGGGGSPDSARVLATLHAELRRAADLTAHFRDLSSRRGSPGQAVAFPPVLDAVLKEREASLKALGVGVTSRVAPDIPPVECAEQILHDIVAKLVDFSLHRLHGARPPRELRVAAVETGPSLVVTISDSGAPLSVTAEEQLATPFRFTQGGGGDLDFALARAMVQAVGGTLRLRPRSPGAEVVMTLPRAIVAPVPLAPPEPRAPPTLPALRILVVDDDAAHRDALTQLLRRDGHDVDAVGDGMAAMQRLREPRDAFDVVLADLQMPQLGGQGLFEQLSTTQPAVARRFVFMTGDRARPETQAFLHECGQPSVMKPYELEELLDAIRAAAGRR